MTKIEVILHVPAEKLGEVMIEFGEFVESARKLDNGPARQKKITRSAPLSAQVARNILSMKGKESAPKAARKSGYSEAVVHRVWSGEHPVLKTKAPA